MQLRLAIYMPLGKPLRLCLHGEINCEKARSPYNSYETWDRLQLNWGAPDHRRRWPRAWPPAPAHVPSA
eukprot:3051239-Rhodomonas_salina.1